MEQTAEIVIRQLVRAFGEHIPTGYEHMHKGAVLSFAAERALDASSPKEVLEVLARVTCDVDRAPELNCALPVATVRAALDGQITSFFSQAERTSFADHCKEMSCNVAAGDDDTLYALLQAIWHVGRLGAFIIPVRNEEQDTEVFRTELARTCFELGEFLAELAPDLQSELERALLALTESKALAARTESCLAVHVQQSGVDHAA